MRRIAILALLVSASAGLAACGDDDDKFTVPGENEVVVVNEDEVRPIHELDKCPNDGPCQ